MRSALRVGMKLGLRAEMSVELMVELRVGLRVEKKCSLSVILGKKEQRMYHMDLHTDPSHN
jgi:hypothetical protein